MSTGLHAVRSDVLRARLADIRRQQHALDRQAAQIVGRLAARGDAVALPEPPPEWLRAAWRTRAELEARGLPTVHGLAHVRHGGTL